MEKGYTDIKWVADLLNAPTRRRYACSCTYTNLPRQTNCESDPFTPVQTPALTSTPHMRSTLTSLIKKGERRRERLLKKYVHPPLARTHSCPHTNMPAHELSGTKPILRCRGPQTRFCCITFRLFIINSRRYVGRRINGPPCVCVGACLARILPRAIRIWCKQSGHNHKHVCIYQGTLIGTWSAIEYEDELYSR